MFHCEKCYAVVGPRQPQRRVVDAIKPRTYVNYEGATTQGWEIKREIGLCGACYKDHKPPVLK